ncbi:hypothetical protein DEO72_LG8g2329 [Vigna unguiculata]|uniref:Uncharacterized protein n=1 Tax=Vigna unguiculata TaxID=3917 RepID=A0A4D6MSD1_VIGUN|nr:hypothetical protein DEO72_LG8g2329 [Vigna unguiculata]
MLRREGFGNGAGAGTLGMDENEGGSRWWCLLEWRLLVREVWWSEVRCNCANEDDGCRGGVAVWCSGVRCLAVVGNGGGCRGG